MSSLTLAFRPKEGSKDRWEIVVDGERWREVHRTIFGHHPLLPPIFTLEELQPAFDLYEYQRVRGYVLWRLSSQSYHSEQLGKLLRQRMVQVQTIEKILENCQEMELLDDEAWVQNFVRSQNKRCGFRMVLNKLYGKGLTADTIERIAKEFKNPDEELRAIDHLLKTRYHKMDLQDFKGRQKVIAALIRKGYAFDQIQSALGTNF